MWDYIVSIHSFAYTYMENGEPEYTKLRTIFNSVLVEPIHGGEMVEVIQISSNSDAPKMMEPQKLLLRTRRRLSITNLHDKTVKVAHKVEILLLPKSQGT